MQLGRRRKDGANKEKKQIKTFGYQEDQHQLNLRAVELWERLWPSASEEGGELPWLGTGNGSAGQLISFRPLEQGRGLPANNCFGSVNYFGGRARDFGSS